MVALRRAPLAPAPSGRRTLHATVTGYYALAGVERVVLRAGGEMLVELIGDDRGEVRIDAIDRERGAAFVDAMASWLGTPLGPASAAGVPSVLRGTFARKPTPGWDVYRIRIGDALFALHISADHTQAVLVEAWQPFRASIVTAFDRAIGAGRLPACRDELVLADGLAMLSIPTTWTSEGGRISDPCARVGLELRVATPGGRTAPMRHVIDRGDVRIGWREESFEDDDRDRGGVRPARVRDLVAATPLVHVTASYAYWCEDATWAIAEWERIVSTLELARAS